MSYNIRIVSTYPTRKCGIGTFSRDLATALMKHTGEIDTLAVAAINKGRHRYAVPVDISFDQYSPRDWDRATTQIIERADEKDEPTVVLLQHEYGLDPDHTKGAEGEAKGNNFVRMAKRFRDHNMYVLTCLHTVLENPNEHQKKVVRELGDLCDGLIVMTESAIETVSKNYGVPKEKIKHIDHGIRLEDPKQNDRLEIKKRMGAEGVYLPLSLGLISPGKGLHYSIPGHARFLQESMTKKQRENFAYLIAGQFHDDFKEVDGGSYYRAYQKMLEGILESCNQNVDGGFKWQKVKSLEEANFRNNDLIFLDNFITEDTLLELYGATNVMVLPYLNMEQISSGILADTLGSGRIALASKFKYAKEMLNSKERHGEGMIITNRGILIDSGNPKLLSVDATIREPCVEQIAQGHDFLVFNEDRRLDMEREAHIKGSDMRWSNSAWKLIQYIDKIRDEREDVRGRGPKFEREKESIFTERNANLIQKLKN
jgi:glycosyltransferase involved in cell wall biosynthesis